MMNARLLVVAALLMTSAALGQEESNPFAVSFYIENDSRLAKPNDASDRHYTNGMAMSIACQPRWAQDLAEWAGGGKGAAGFIAGQLMFTPQNIRTPSPDTRDEPYAGYLFGGLYLQREKDNVLDHIQLDLGWVGEGSGAHWVQSNWHHFVGADVPQGWGHQLGDEFTAQLFYRRKWRWDLFGLSETSQTPLNAQGQLIPYAGLAAGSVYRHLEGGATLRIGWSLPDDFGPGRLADPASATGKRPGNDRVNFYGFVRAGGRAVEHDLFLDGSTWRDSAHVTHECLVGEVQPGLALNVRFTDSFAFETVYSQTYMTKQFKGQREADAYGAWTASFIWRF